MHNSHPGGGGGFIPPGHASSQLYSAGVLTLAGGTLELPAIEVSDGEGGGGGGGGGGGVLKVAHGGRQTARRVPAGMSVHTLERRV